MNDQDSSSWDYLKLYFGQQAERADAFLVALCRQMAANDAIQSWFYLRYVDEGGFHVRLRFLAHGDRREEAVQRVRAECGALLDRIYDFLPNTYRPMVTLPDYLSGDVALPKTDPRLRIETDTYVPEADKYGSRAGIRIAERLFHLSSELAGIVLADEARNRYSRKTLAPWLMHDAAAAFPARQHADYWSQYSLYWLGGDSAAAQDWLARFRRKAVALREAGQPVCTPEDAMPAEAAAVVRRWRAGLAEAARAYRTLADGSDARPDVLSLNFSHLMMNRLGIATLEESMLAALLQASRDVSMVAA